jgi:hypothetical protein
MYKSCYIKWFVFHEFMRILDCTASNRRIFIEHSRYTDVLFLFLSNNRRMKNVKWGISPSLNLLYNPYIKMTNWKILSNLKMTRHVRFDFILRIALAELNECVINISCISLNIFISRMYTVIYTIQIDIFIFKQRIRTEY